MSVVADAKKNWLDQVKADAEELTRKRLAEDLPKLDKVAEQMDAQSLAKAEGAPTKVAEPVNPIVQPAPSKSDKEGTK